MSAPNVPERPRLVWIQAPGLAGRGTPTTGRVKAEARPGASPRARRSGRRTGPLPLPTTSHPTTGALFVNFSDFHQFPGTVLPTQRRPPQQRRQSGRDCGDPRRRVASNGRCLTRPRREGLWDCGGPPVGGQDGSFCSTCGRWRRKRRWKPGAFHQHNYVCL